MFYPEQLCLPAIASGMPTLDSVYCCDALELLKALPAGSVDCVVTSPPYNMGTQLNGAKACSKSTTNWNAKLLSVGYDTFDDAMPYPEYVDWQRAVLTEAMRVIKDTGAIFYNHKWRIQGGMLEDRKSVVDGFPVRQIVIWDRCSGNNHNDAFFTPQYEVVYMIAKRGFYVRRDAPNYGDVWRIPFETDTPHPAPFPVELPKRCILAACPPGGIVVDPFAGSGSTAVAAKQTGRHFIAGDIGAEYVALARKRLADTDPYADKQVTPELKQKSMFSELTI